ncbi:MAG TPA: cytochrome P450 [Acidimicrobiales bacterium]|jgi:cytochrome P450|nr:cytochrome P450 [Acidimicrobiales bacterium]
MTSTDSLSTSEAGLVFIDPGAYADEARFHQATTLLRRESPVHWVQGPGYRPFWALTRHADVMEVERDNHRFLSAPRPLLATEAAEQLAIEKGEVLRTLIHMDEPDHKAYRAVAATWFQPNSLRRLEERMNELAVRFVDRMAELGSDCDFVRDVAVHYPLYVILSLLGLPESDFDRMLMLTQQLFGGDDPELQRSTDLEEQFTVLLDFFNYFTELTASRREHPTEDLASALANATIDGAYIPDMDLASYYVIIATAGHDTTSSTIAGGLYALLQHPAELARLQGDLELLPSAVEEMIRWVTPVKEFMRTASEDAVVGGTQVAAGDSLYLAYLSANRDEDVFDDPFRFDVGRQPNKHLAFGFGPHFCLGAQLARLETRALFAELLPRLESIELAGTPTSSATVFVGGLKTLPVHYTIRPG